MKRLAKSLGVISALAGLAVSLHSAAAHHATAMYDHTKTVTVTGTIVELRWVNPHVSLAINGKVNESDQPTLWLFESTSPGNLVRRGWARTMFKAGERVQVTMNPLHDSDKKGGSIVKVTFVDSGQVLTANIRDESPGRQ